MIWHNPTATLSVVVDDAADAYRVRLAIYEDNEPQGRRLVGELWAYETSRSHLESIKDRLRVAASDLGLPPPAEG